MDDDDAADADDADDESYEDDHRWNGGYSLLNNPFVFACKLKCLLKN